VTGTGHNAGAFVVSTKNADDDAGWPIFRNFGSTNRYRALPRNTRHKRIGQLEPMKHRPSSDWMGRLRDKEKSLLPAGFIAKFGKGYGRNVAGKSVGRKWV
jgi:hypothetical protein